ncbi:hypothetical protein [Sphingomonas sp. Ag1]|jgi:hypothetical protein|uniref:hypothetical protein n=1 Tax=Sphingomonas sp. Ag1 TaxID=1642949 RepID=UPI000622AAA2|nr:hypothetical protein [Sphingomonas sp. Ag1]KKI22013.1 hypothetical protein XM50_01295 [Sphingomonas sp. Ag1]
MIGTKNMASVDDLTRSPRQVAPLAKPRAALSLSGGKLQRALFLLPLAATCYSTVLAILIARGFPGSTALVVVIELLLLGGCIVVCFRSGLSREDVPALLFVYSFVVGALVVSMIVGRPMVETLRASAIIGLFVLVGQRMSYPVLDRLFATVTIFVLIVLLLEVFWLDAYVTIFSPAKFFAATRGIEASEFNNTGLFNTATSYEGRFGFGLFDGPRASSIFLEQVSNANFACVAAMYLAVRGRELPRGLLFVEIATVVLILVTANSRFGSLLVLLTLIGYGIFPLLPRITLPLGSLAIVAGALVFIIRDIDAIGDDLQGRIAFAGREFREADLSFYLGGDALRSLAQRDAGYTYWIGTTTIFGMIILWLFVNLMPRMDDAPSRRLGWGLTFYFLGQLLVSATSILSIKTAALLWVLIGCVRTKGGVLASEHSRA